VEIGRPHRVDLHRTYLPLPSPNQALLAKWGRLRELRAVVNKAIEEVRSSGSLGSSLQANLRLTLDAEDLALLRSLGDELKFVFIVSAVELQPGAQLAVQVRQPAPPSARAAGTTATTWATTRRTPSSAAAAPATCTAAAKCAT